MDRSGLEMPEIRYELHDGRLVRIEEDAPIPSHPPAAGGDSREGFLGHLFRTPGTGESLAALPASALGLIPAAKPLSIPAAGLLGALGGVIDQAAAGTLDPRGVAAAGLRQAGLELAGGLITKAARPVMGVFGMPGARTAAVQGALEGRVASGRGAERHAQRTRGAVDDLARTMPIVPSREITGVMRDVARREMAGSATPLDTARHMLGDIRRVEGQNPITLSASQVLTKKRTASRGFQQREAARVEGRPTTMSAEMREGFRAGAQRALESRSPQYRPLSDRAGRAAETRRYYFKKAQQPDSSLYLGLTGLLRGQPALQLPGRLSALLLQDLGRMTPSLTRAIPLVPSHER